MRYKDDRLKQEFTQLQANNPKLYKILDMLDDYCLVEFNKDICITCIYRTKEENDALYAPNPAKNSPHLYWQAADIRSTDFNDKQIPRMLQFLNSFSYKDGQGRPVAIYHQIPGNVMHFHLQTN